MDTTTSPVHCGACGVACPPGALCRGGCRPSVERATRLGSPGLASARAVAVDALGNAYVAGHFAETLAVGETTLASAGGDDGFLVSYGPDGSFRWVTRFGGPGDDVLRGVALDATTNRLIVVGTVSEDLTVGTDDLTVRGERDVLVVAVDLLGNVTWSRTLGGDGAETGKRVAASEGHAYVVMDYDASFALDGLTVAAEGELDGLMVRLDATSGSALAFDRVASAGFDVLDGVAAVGSFACAAGFFGGPAMLEGGATIAPVGGFDAIVRCRDFAGSERITRTFGSLENDQLAAVSIRGDVIAYVGVIGGPASIGSTAISAPSGVWDPLVGLISRTTGAFASARRFSSTGDFDYPSDVHLGAGGEVIWTSRLLGALTSPIELPHQGSSDAFVATLESDLELRWARIFGSSGDDGFSGVAEGVTGDLWLTGELQGAVSFDGTTLISAGSYDGVVLRLAL
ncbi:MAG: hypothetical protein KF901_16260, partial [Myxococcales bacterium]|nr:hypothetical protein [Myxococcales bacterium]